ncbi:MAG: sigma-70 family RNA polymerase sigma factor [Pirellulales bacterium]
MSDDHSKAFPATSWTLVAQAGQEDGTTHREVLGRLLSQYLPALRAHLVFDRRIPSDQADDLLQEFVVNKILERNLLRQADRSKGRFRTFLMTVLDHYVIDRRRVRGPSTVAAEEVDPADPAALPDDAFNQAWARQVIAAAVDRMQAECEVLGRADVWGVFQGRVLGPILDQAEPTAYENTLDQFGFRSSVQAANILTTAKRMFGRILRTVVAGYVQDGDVEEEICELRRILSQRA